MTWRKLFFALTDSAIISASVVMVVIGTLVFGNFLVLSGFSEVVTEGILALELSPLGLFCLLVGVYLVIGTMMEATATLALTIPLVMPIVATMGWDPVWFGVVLVTIMEISFVTPPVGLNLYVVKAAMPDLTLTDICVGSSPFWLVNILVVAILYMLPDIALILPGMM
jgi:TRAP-type C4-dicarboxylate transport system permease large subunit